MGDKSKIQWTEATWNPVAGCEVISPGCANCYAMRQAGTRLAHTERYQGLTRETDRGPIWTGEVRTVSEALDLPLRWRRPRMVFVNSMSDLFHEDVPYRFIESVFHVMARCPQHTFQILTKRAERMAAWFETLDGVGLGYDGKARERGKIMMGSVEYDWPLSNVWLGVSAEDQKRLDEREELLAHTPAAVRFLSLEPLLSEIDLSDVFARTRCPRCGITIVKAIPTETSWCADCCIAEVNEFAASNARPDSMHHGHFPTKPVIDWVIVGGESGRGARPCDTRWIRDIVTQCQAAGVRCFVKQLGSHVEATSAIDPIDQFPNDRIPRFSQGRGPHTARIHLRHSKGADPAEWPEDLRVQEFPSLTTNN